MLIEVIDMPTPGGSRFFLEDRKMSKIVFATKKEVIEFMRTLSNYVESGSGFFYSKGRYYLAHGEYDRPDYWPTRYKDGWGVREKTYFYPNTFYARKSGRCELVDVGGGYGEDLRLTQQPKY